MIVFGCAITESETYERCAGPGIQLAREPDSRVLVHNATGSLFRNYNILLDQVAQLNDVEALVLLHQDTEIVDPDFCDKVRAAIADPMVAIFGCVGSIGARNIAWWEGSVTWASFTHRYPEHEFGGGDFPAFTWDLEHRPAFAETGEVDNVDGFLLGLTPWALANLRFDESLGKIHGYDADLCLQAREAGRKIVTADLKVVHHHSLELIGDPETWIEAHIRVAEKWDGRVPTISEEGGDYKQRARRAEAEAGMLRNKIVAVGLQAQAHARQLQAEADRLRDDLGQVAASSSWRLTRPLRTLRDRLGAPAPLARTPQSSSAIRGASRVKTRSRGRRRPRRARRRSGGASAVPASIAPGRGRVDDPARGPARTAASAGSSGSACRARPRRSATSGRGPGSRRRGPERRRPDDPDVAEAHVERREQHRDAGREATSARKDQERERDQVQAARPRR